MLCDKWCALTAFFLLAGTTVFVAAFATEAWSVGNGYKVGLWNICEEVNDRTYCDNLSLTKPQWLVWTRVLGCAAIIALICAHFHYLCTSCCDQCARKCMLIWQIILIFGSVAAQVMTMVVYASDYQKLEDSEADRLGYSFFLVVLSIGLCSISGLFAVVDLCTSGSYDFQHERLK